MISDSYFMKKAIDLARLGMNMTSPNPRVGCVLVKNGKIIGSGYHRKFGLPHAEIEALNSASESVRGSTAFVTLEPCTHFGKTPPCSKRLISEGIKRVVVASKDPNPQDGIEILRKNRIDVTTGVLEEEAEELIKGYIKWTVEKRPFITAKVAISWDGKIATKTGESRWITSDESREWAMRLRGENDAIIVGVRTVNCDNPLLTYRLKEPLANQPLRVVIDGGFEINLKSGILGENTLIITLPEADAEKKRQIEDRGAEVVEIKGEGGIIPPDKIAEHLYSRNIMSAVIEGGGTTTGNFLTAGRIDRVIFIVAPLLLGGSAAPTACDGTGFSNLKDAPKLKNIRTFNIGDDIVLQGDLKQENKKRRSRTEHF